jgi:tetratricopeptide (TPR) repeat protein
MLRSRNHVVPAARTRALSLVVAFAFALAVCVAFGLAPGSARAADPAPGAAAAPAAPKQSPTAAAKQASKNAKALPDSLPSLEAAVKKDSTNAKALYRLGIAYLDRDRPADAARMFQKATKVKPDYVEAWVNLGAAEDANGTGGVARTHYREALRLRPGDEIATCRLASSFYAVGIKDSAMDVLRQAISANPKSHCAYFTLGVAYADAGMFREAIKAWQLVIDNAPTSPEAESATESIKLLKEYLGPQEALNQTAATPGVAPGSGGPGTPMPGGGMMNAAAKPATPAPADPKAGSVPEKKSTGH